MLNTASDYKFLKTTDIGSFINGDIMPLKFPNKNTIAPVRFEDYLFLTEGFLERMNVEQAGSNNTLPPVRTIYASKILGSVIDSINGTASGPAMGYNGHRGYYINPDSNVRTDNLTVSGNTSIAILGDYVTNYKFDTVAIKMPSELKPSNYARRPLFAEYIRARYYDLNRLKLLSFRTAIGDLAESATTYYYDTNGQITSSQNQNLSNTQYGSLILTMPTTDNKAYKYQEQVLNLKQNIITLPYAKSARLIFDAVANKSTSSSTQYRTISSVNLTIANGNVQCPNDLIDTIINTTLNSANLTLYDTSGNVSVFLYSCDLLIEFDFPASFDSNWNWQP